MALLRPPAVQGGSAQLADLWRQGLNRNHDPGCGCGGLFAPAVNARVIEEDFLDYLHARYVKDGISELANFVAVRRREVTSGIGANTFEGWLICIESATLSDAGRERLMKDIYVFVDSLGGGDQRGPGVCY